MKRLVLASALLALGGCAVAVPFNTAPSRKENTQLSQLSGTITYRQRIALPSDAVATVTLQDVSRADAPAVTIAAVTFATNGRQVPIPFTMEYDPARIVENMRYGVRAQIADAAGKLIWTTDTHFPLSFAGEPIELTLVPVGG